ncbi:GNAT family N-acetyltransferase [Pararhodobacter aggregans]|uniref:GNAT family N-acetyltransferase n=1 Tax=Pararhodobacter aggregans TaxID=404875 RepID=A0A2T7UVK5_9RHOB|nr:GNAT family N-acetyltransferase [Pararhodobacter aggregans]PTX03846.1 acetyltransferase (GNAT) family protein [Pararhodobacter aggregans]PVE48674.1 GNAT family N-acetyltransferase [Pararhodobacter aggregans]
MPDALILRPLTPEYRDDFLTVMGPSGACYGCWCTYFRLPPKTRAAMSGDQKRDLMLGKIAEGPPPGLLLYLDGEPQGWMQIGPRAEVPQWNNPRRSSTPLPDAPADDPAVWAITCFFLRPKARGRGLSQVMVEAGIDHARAQGARVLEASPMDQAKQSKSVGLFVGSTAVFERAGFATVARQKPNRPLMRFTL